MLYMTVWVGLAVSVSASHMVGIGFASQPKSYWSKTIIKMVQTASLHRHACFWVEV